MTNISTRQIDSPDYKAAFNELARTITRLNKSTAPYLLNELLTESERIMIVKRFGALCMFTHSYSPYRVSLTLGLSFPTTSRLYEQFEQGMHANLLKSLNKKEVNGFLSLIEDLIAAKASPKARARLMNRASFTGKY